jgi:DNA-binding GntR family transcriptional regulator
VFSKYLEIFVVTSYFQANFKYLKQKHLDSMQLYGILHAIMERNRNSKGLKSGLLDQLRQQILLGKLEPGLFIRQATIAEQFGVSRTPVREVLKALESEGLLENLPECGYRVRKRTLRDLIEIIDVRALMEGYAAKLAAMSPESQQLDAMLALAEKIDESRKLYIETQNLDDLTKWSNYEQEFHQSIIIASQNKFLLQFVQSMNFRWVELMASDALPNPQDSKLPTHYQIVEAIERKDLVAAEEYARKHVSFYKLIGIESYFGPTAYWDSLS